MLTQCMVYSSEERWHLGNREERNSPFVYLFFYFYPLAPSCTRYLSFCSNLLVLPIITFSYPGNQATSELLTSSFKSLENFQSLHYTEIFSDFCFNIQTHPLNFSR